MDRRTALGLAALALAFSTPAPRPLAAQQPQAAGTVDDLRAERTRGSDGAPVTMYEISDFECPFCGEFWRETLPSIERDYIATGKVRLIFVNMPLTSLHPNAEPAAEVAMCMARQHKFWPVHDLLFRTQDHWADLKNPAPYFLTLADSVHGSRGELQVCLTTKATRSLVEADVDGSRRSGATSTPTFYIEGTLIVGSQPFSLFKQVLDSIVAVKTK